MSKDFISVISPTLNGLQLLEKTLPLLCDSLKSLTLKTELIIVDNGSTDGTKAFIDNLNFNIVYVKKDRNEGFSKGCNAGAKAASGNYLFFINNDIIVEGDFLSPLLKIHKATKNVFAVGPKFMRWDKVTLDDAKRNPVFENGLFDVVLDNDNLDKTGAMVFFLGGGFLVSRDAFFDLGGFDEIYTPFAWEDLDLGYRSIKRGFSNLYCPDVTMFHKREATSKEKFTSVQFKSIVWKNKFIFMWSNLTDIDIILKHLLLLPVKLIKFTFNGRWPYVFGFIRALFVIHRILRKRYREKQFFKLSDKNILDGSWKNGLII